jgi:chloramphenicol-sensitive protein RarD
LRSCAGLVTTDAEDQLTKSPEYTKGVWFAVLAYGIWGGFPIYWKYLAGIPALQLVCHRIVWSCLLLLGLVTAQRDWRRLAEAVRSRRVVAIYTAAAIAIAVNWFVFVWAVNEGLIVQVALGYFINPLFSVVLGVVIFREKLSTWEWVAVALAAAGVLYLTVFYGTFPWIALTLTVTFGTYGLLKKLAPLGALLGLTLETGILFLPAAAVLVDAYFNGSVGFLHENGLRNGLMVLAGPVTAAPLLFFAAAARRIPLSMMGMLQYINPTIQFLIGTLLYKEPFSASQFVGFGLVWIALVVFAVQGAVLTAGE